MYLRLTAAILLTFSFGGFEGGNCFIYGPRKPLKDTLVVFGAAFEDDGVNPPNDTVGLHVMSTGKVWPQMLAEQMKMTLKDYAVMGGTTGIDDVFFKGWGGNKWQVNTYLNATGGKVPPNVLIGIGTGAVAEVNVIQFTDEAFTGMANNITGIVQQLVNAGADSVFVLNLCDYTMAPAFQPGSTFGDSSEAFIKQQKGAVTSYNTKFDAAWKTLVAKNPSVKLMSMDFNKFWSDSIQTKPYKTTFGMTYGDGTAMPLGTTKPDDMPKYAFYDAYHPASGVHYDVANNIRSELAKGGIYPNF